MAFIWMAPIGALTATRIGWYLSIPSMSTWDCLFFLSLFLARYLVSGCCIILGGKGHWETSWGEGLSSSIYLAGWACDGLHTMGVSVFARGGNFVGYG